MTNNVTGLWRALRNIEFQTLHLKAGDTFNVIEELSNSDVLIEVQQSTVTTKLSFLRVVAVKT